MIVIPNANYGCVIYSDLDDIDDSAVSLEGLLIHRRIIDAKMHDIDEDAKECWNKLNVLINDKALIQQGKDSICHFLDEDAKECWIDEQKDENISAAANKLCDSLINGCLKENTLPVIIPIIARYVGFEPQVYHKYLQPMDEDAEEEEDGWVMSPGYFTASDEEL